MKGRWLHWLHGCTGSRDRLAALALAASVEPCFDPHRPIGGPVAAGTAWRSGGPAVAARRRPTGEPAAAGSARQSRAALRHQRTRRDRGTDPVAAVITVIDVVAITVGHGEIAVTVATLAVVGSAVIAEISVITAIAETTMTVDIVAPAGRGRHERAARTARAAAVFVDDEP